MRELKAKLSAAGWVTPSSSSGLQPVRRRRSDFAVLDAIGEDRDG